jgi:hypothetical protein
MPKKLTIANDGGERLRLHVVDYRHRDLSVGHFREGWICKALDGVPDDHYFIDCNGTVEDYAGVDIGWCPAVSRWTEGL